MGSIKGVGRTVCYYYPVGISRAGQTGGGLLYQIGCIVMGMLIDRQIGCVLITLIIAYLPLSGRRVQSYQTGDRAAGNKNNVGELFRWFPNVVTR